MHSITFDALPKTIQRAYTREEVLEIQFRDDPDEPFTPKIRVTSVKGTDLWARTEIVCAFGFPLLRPGWALVHR